MEIYGHIKECIYRNEKNGYTVIKCTQNHTSYVAVGYMPDIIKGCDYTFTGEWKKDPLYGEEFYVKSYMEDIPKTEPEIAAFLSNIISDISPMMAVHLVSVFGTNIFHVMESNPEILMDFDFDMETAKKIQTEWIEYKEIKDIRSFLQQYDINTIYATKLYNVYQNNSIFVLRSNPYCLLNDVYGMTFCIVDSIAKKLGIRHTAMTRIKSGILYVMQRYSSAGHCFAERTELVKESTKLLQVDPRIVDNTVQYLIEFRSLISDNGIYLADLYQAEQYVARRLNDIRDTYACQVNGFIMEGYDREQKRAIEYAMTNKITILTGGPGTGKTTTVSGIIRAFKGKNVILTAPTGRAAKRLEEVTQTPAETIHRLLDAKTDGTFGRDELNPISGDLLIVDECSMIDIKLMYHLLQAVPDRMRVVFVGDADQLPSIGPGNVFADMIRSGSFPVVSLTTVFRTGGLIKRNANRIKHGQPLIFNQDDSCIFFDIDELTKSLAKKKPNETIDPETTCKNAVKYLVSKYLPQHYTFQDIQILAPMKKGNVGTYALNEQFRKSGNKFIEFNNKMYYLHDKVMQIRNNYDKEIYNGDIGYICCINEVDETVFVDFGGQIAEYRKRELDQLSPAYAITIHKSQGGEYPVVILVLMPGHKFMLERNLFYTGMTRAKEKLIVVGTKDAIAKAIQTQKVINRNTTLCERIRDYDFSVQKKNIC